MVKATQRPWPGLPSSRVSGSVVRRRPVAPSRDVSIILTQSVAGARRTPISVTWRSLSSIADRSPRLSLDTRTPLS